MYGDSLQLGLSLLFAYKTFESMSIDFLLGLTIFIILDFLITSLSLPPSLSLSLTHP